MCTRVSAETSFSETAHKLLFFLKTRFLTGLALMSNDSLMWKAWWSLTHVGVRQVSSPIDWSLGLGSSFINNISHCPGLSLWVLNTQCRVKSREAWHVFWHLEGEVKPSQSSGAMCSLSLPSSAGAGWCDPLLMPLHSGVAEAAGWHRARLVQREATPGEVLWHCAGSKWLAGLERQESGKGRGLSGREERSKRHGVRNRLDRSALTFCIYKPCCDWWVLQ